MTYITNVFHMTVEPDVLEEFKSLIAEIVDLSSKEPGTLIYEYSLGEDGRSVHIVERYLTEGVLPHVEKTFGPYAEKFLKLAKIQALYVYGLPPADLKTKLESFGAIFLTPLAGFARPVVSA
ncbi:antibiotic biosynthesis monooxygenase [Neorhizobium sp. JUb45]|uniref:putative quinol monooxygenase n=1 Tax=Neorhizobium sp. JUb45 TaxID=2485113 RepID=UPI00104EABF6|nr:antibiotic biosynthesis monooxygenase [Neorhizobium sp. JUb45]TCQ97328.1 antibiotic biosynthesis monooxygenase [Neorhizobium sp. JUb45]